MKKILGLDLGSSSIGWSFIEENKEKSKIKRMGVRIIPLGSDEKDQFTKGQAISINKDRTLKRTARKTNHRYKIRREKLLSTLEVMGMLPTVDQILKISSLTLYELRSNAVDNKIELTNLGRVLLHLNQKRGYKSSRHTEEEEDGKKLSDYLSELKGRKDLIEHEGITIGQYFYKLLKEDPFYRIKENVFPRECYVQEFDTIWDKQSTFYPDILTNEKKNIIRNEIIFYQRRLKSQKKLVSECSFEKHHKVAPKTSPLFQVEKIWESIHTISIRDKYNQPFLISQEQKLAIFNYLDNSEKITKTNLLRLLQLKTSDNWQVNEQIEKTGIQGNITKSKLIKVFKELNIERPELLQFNLKTLTAVNHLTGEVKEYEIVSPEFEQEPLYQLWHVIYSLDEPQLLIQTLMKKFELSKEQAEALNKVDFKKPGFGNKSAKAIRKLLPGLMNGLDYSKAASSVGYNHSNSITKEQNEERLLTENLKHYAKNSLRQPVVEKVLNQLINLINNILEDPELGRPDEIRIELSRELRQSKDERNEAYSRNIKTDKEHKAIIERINNEFPGLPVSRKMLEKYKLFIQQDGICMYSGKKMELSRVLRGEGIDVDHIIPQSRLFDDSFQNKVLSYQEENKKKDNNTAYDYMKAKSEDDFSQFIERVARLKEDKKITRSKHDKLLMKGIEIPDDFINRQLNETRFISKESVKLLKNICRNVYATSGSVTEFLRREWGYNEVLKQLNWKKYEKAGLVKDDKIEGWSKRDDHRHHAIDALVVACTNQGYIQKLNNLNSQKVRDEMASYVKGKAEANWQARKSLLEQFVQTQQPFTTQEVKEAVSNILISLKAGKKVASGSVNKKAGNQKTLTPRGQLHKEQVYGKIRKYAAKKTPLNGRFNQTELISNPVEKKLVAERLLQFNGDPKKAFKDLDKNPIWLDEAKTKSITEVTLWEDHFVYKYTLDQNFKEKDVDFIVDVKIREKVRERFKQKAGTGEHPLKNLENEPIWLHEEKKIPIKSVRCFTGLNDLVPLHIAENGNTKPNRFKTENSKPVDFVSTRNNHHIAIYQDADGKLHETTVSLWEAVERKKLGIPVIINNPSATWDYVLEKGIDNQALLNNMPLNDWTYYMCIQQNELFVLNFEMNELNKAIKNNKYELISPKLYRVQKISSKDYFFRHHLETKLEKDSSEEKMSIEIGKMIRVKSLIRLKELNPIKVQINSIGSIKIVL
jgi:CRISPR-associated endonuclease Csn1